MPQPQPESDSHPGLVRALPVRFQTAFGEIVIEVYPDLAPQSAGQFLWAVEQNWYLGGSFWRAVRPDNDRGVPTIQVVQASTAAAQLGQPIAPAIPHEPTLVTGLRHVCGAVSLARGAPGTATADSFFICVGEQPALDYGGARNPDGLGFAAFGRVVEGMDVVRAIQRGATVAEASVEFIGGQVLARPVSIVSVRKGPARTRLIEPVSP